MRRIVALLAAVILLGSLASASVAATPSLAKANHFVGNFDLVAEGTNRVVGHIVAEFKEPTSGRLVPGTLDVRWAPYDVSNPPFPYFMPLDGSPIRESHAQLLSAWFDTYDDAVWGHVVTAGTDGYLCDYAGPWNAGCRYFSVLFQKTTLGPARLTNWSPGGPADPDRFVLVAGRGVFDLTFVGPTGG